MFCHHRLELHAACASKRALTSVNDTTPRRHKKFHEDFCRVYFPKSPRRSSLTAPEKIHVGRGGVMAGRGRQSRDANALRCRRIVLLSSSTGAFVGLGGSPMTTANANELDLISDPQSARGRARTVEYFQVKSCLSRT